MKYLGICNKPYLSQNLQRMLKKHHALMREMNAGNFELALNFENHKRLVLFKCVYPNYFWVKGRHWRLDKKGNFQLLNLCRPVKFDSRYYG